MHLLGMEMEIVQKPNQLNYLGLENKILDYNHHHSLYLLLQVMLLDIFYIIVAVRPGQIW